LPGIAAKKWIDAAIFAMESIVNRVLMEKSEGVLLGMCFAGSS